MNGIHSFDFDDRASQVSHSRPSNSRGTSVPSATSRSSVSSRPAKDTDLSIGTRSLLKNMMRASKLSYSQQKYLDEFIANPQGPSLPGNPFRDMHAIEMRVFRSMVSDAESKRAVTSLFDKPMVRTRQQIQKLGMYDRDQYRHVPMKDMSVEKKCFQDTLEGIPVEKDTIKRKRSSLDSDDSMSFSKLLGNEEEEDEFSMLGKEIEERRQWLDDMISLGRGELYKRQIQGEIALRVSRMEQIHKEKSFKEKQTTLCEAST